MMEQYSGLAKIYDLLMSSIDYENWADYVDTLVRKYGGIPDKTALDLACGTGSTTLALSRLEYRVTGLDLAWEMLEAAAAKSAAAQVSVNFIQADMREFVLPREVGLVVAFQDGLNYLLTEEDLRRTMQAVHKALQPGGLFIFDINRVEKLSGITGSSHVETEEFTLIWESSFLDPDVWEISVTGFVPAGDGLYRRFSERHKERVISMAEVCSALRSAGLTLRAVHKAFSLKPPDDEAQRLFFVAGREKSMCM